MERKVISVCSVVGFLGLLSAALDFAAEAMRMKGSQVQLASPSTCTNPSSTVVHLGLIAVDALGFAQAIVSVETGCFCLKRGPHLSKTNPALAVICSAVSWFTYAIAVLLYFCIASYYCYFGKPGVFAVAAILSLASVIFHILHYLVLYSAKGKTNAPGVGPAPPPPNQAGIAMGQPQFPPPNTQASVFMDQNNCNIRVESQMMGYSAKTNTNAPGVGPAAAAPNQAGLAMGYSAKNKTTAPGDGPAAASPNQASVAMEQPQFPPTNTQASVFVHQNNCNIRVESRMMGYSAKNETNAPGVGPAAAAPNQASIAMVYSAKNKTTAPGVGPAAAPPNQAGIAMGCSAKNKTTAPGVGPASAPPNQAGIAMGQP